MADAIIQDLPTPVTHPRALPLRTPIIRDFFAGATGPLVSAADGNTTRLWVDLSSGSWVKDGGVARATATPGTPTNYFVGVVQPSFDVSVTAQLAANGGTSTTTNGAGVFALYLDAANHLRVTRSGGPDGWRLQKVLANVPTTAIATGVTENVGDLLNLRVIGNTATVTITPSGGAPQVFTWTILDDFLAAVTAASTLYAGLRSPRSGSTSSAAFDNFEVRQAMVQ